MSRAEIVRRLKRKNPALSTSTVNIVIDSFCENICKALFKGKNIEIRGFGTFFIKRLKRNFSARNPKTGELIYVPERKKIRFKPSKKLKIFINEKT